MRKRTVSDKWGDVFDILIGSPGYEDGIDVDQLMTVALDLGVNITRETARVKLHRYVNRGYLKKISRGKYAITKDGLRFFKVNLPISKWAKKVTAEPDWNVYVRKKFDG